MQWREELVMQIYIYKEIQNTINLANIIPHKVLLSKFLIITREKTWICGSGRCSRRRWGTWCLAPAPDLVPSSRDFGKVWLQGALVSSQLWAPWLWAKAVCHPSQIVSTFPSSEISAWHCSHLLYGQLFHFRLLWSCSALLKFQDERSEVWHKCREPNCTAWPSVPSLEHLQTPYMMVIVSHPHSGAMLPHSCTAIPTNTGSANWSVLGSYALNKLALLFWVSLLSCWPLVLWTWLVYLT